jgi:hypothetical protein
VCCSALLALPPANASACSDRPAARWLALGAAARPSGGTERRAARGAAGVQKLVRVGRGAHASGAVIPYPKRGAPQLINGGKGARRAASLLHARRREPPPPQALPHTALDTAPPDTAAACAACRPARPPAVGTKDTPKDVAMERTYDKTQPLPFRLPAWYQPKLPAAAQLDAARKKWLSTAAGSSGSSSSSSGSGAAALGGGEAGLFGFAARPLLQRRPALGLFQGSRRS